MNKKKEFNLTVLCIVVGGILIISQRKALMSKKSDTIMNKRYRVSEGTREGKVERINLFLVRELNLVMI